jgi:hypothetical protein
MSLPSRTDTLDEMINRRDDLVRRRSVVSGGQRNSRRSRPSAFSPQGPGERVTTWWSAPWPAEIERHSQNSRARRCCITGCHLGKTTCTFADVKEDGYFDERIAAVYDDYVHDETREEFAVEDVNATVDFLIRLAGEGPALEFGVGTGRIALPLSQRGVPTHGIDLSRPMVARLKAKPGGEDIAVAIGDFATASVEGSFSLVYLICNTIMNATTQQAQVACFRNAAAHLHAGGRFVVKVMVPELQRLPPGETMHVFAASDKHWGIDEYEVGTQRLISHHFEDVDGRLERSSIPFRYVWPSELDLMAQLAGLTLLERYGGWNGEPFTSESRKHVSVWEKPVGSSRNTREPSRAREGTVPSH